MKGMKIVLRDEERTKAEVWTRVIGYHQVTTNFNIGKKQEYKERVTFKESIAMKSLAVA